MAKRLIWSPRAKAGLVSILEYWEERNGSPAYSQKLLSRIVEHVLLLPDNPHLGKATTIPGVRVIFCGDYLIFYRVNKAEIYIANLVDGRMNPGKFHIR